MPSYIDELSDAPSIGRPSSQRAGVQGGEHVSTETLVESLLAGEALHESSRDLAARGYTEEQLYELFDQSDAREARPVEWAKRRADVPRLVRSAAKKRLAEAARIFATPAQLPNGASVTPTGQPMSTPTPPLAPIVLPVMRPADMAALPVKARRWIVQDVIPEGEPTLVYGKGATGKSLLLFQLAICIASGRKWVDREVPHGRAVFFTCEDGVDELNRRGASVLKMLGIDWSDCGERLLIIPMRGAEADAVLATPNSNGTLTPTGTYEALKAVVGDFRPDLVVVDTLADTFAGDENRRAEAKQFVNMIARLRIDATHVVTAHPSVSAEADGRGSSGSTGWPAAVRSHLTFSRIKDGKYKADGDVRLLENKKGNYAAEGAGAILMRWKEGAFVPESGSAELSEADVDALFLALLHKYHGTGRRISAHMAPSTFAKEAEAVAAGVTKAKLDAAKHRLFDAQRIGQEPSKGSNGRESTRLVILDVGGPMPWRPAQD